MSRHFQVNNDDPLLVESRHSVRLFRVLYAHSYLHFVEGNDGARFGGSVEAQVVRSPPSKHLKLESLTRSLYVNAPQGITLDSATGSVDISSFQDIQLKSLNGKVRGKNQAWLPAILPPKSIFAKML